MPATTPASVGSGWSSWWMPTSPNGPEPTQPRQTPLSPAPGAGRRLDDARGSRHVPDLSRLPSAARSGCAGLVFILQEESMKRSRWGLTAGAAALAALVLGAYQVRASDPVLIAVT